MPGDGPVAISATSLIVAGLGTVPGVTTHPTLATIDLPLPGEPATVDLMVIEVGRIVEPVSPHGGSGWRLNQPAMS